MATQAMFTGPLDISDAFENMHIFFASIIAGCERVIVVGDMQENAIVMEVFSVDATSFAPFVDMHLALKKQLGGQKAYLVRKTSVAEDGTGRVDLGNGHSMNVGLPAIRLTLRPNSRGKWFLRESGVELDEKRVSTTASKLITVLKEGGKSLPPTGRVH